MKANDKHSFIVDGHKVNYSNGLVEFTQYGVYVKCDEADFTYDFAVKMDYRFQVLKCNKLLKAGL